MASSDIHATLKLLMIGDSGTGKSSLLLRFIDDAWLQPDEVSATIGVDFKMKILDIDDHKYKLTIWDTAGQERFRTLTSSYYRGAQGVILGLFYPMLKSKWVNKFAVYDVSNRETFEHLQQWITELDTYSSSKDVVMIIVGNKIDKDVTGVREVPQKEGAAFARKMEALFIETSAKTRAGVKDAFEEVVRKIIEKPSLWQKTSNATGNATVSLDAQNNDENVGSYGDCSC
ncbi:Ras- protein Rab-18 [Nowakowskiella sp. JEL0078]|nr:Ras- protein Rab-18 [Nowakowskiella sp. JEL0078]